MADQEQLEESAGGGPPEELEAEAAPRPVARRGEAQAMRGSDPAATARAREFFNVPPARRAVWRRGRR